MPPKRSSRSPSRKKAAQAQAPVQPPPTQGGSAVTEDAIPRAATAAEPAPPAIAVQPATTPSTGRLLRDPVFLLVLAAVVVGAALRFFDIADAPRGFNQDEAVASYDAYSLTRSTRDHLGHPLNPIAFESYGDWAPPVQTIVLTPAAALFGPEVMPLRIWNALLALSVVPLVYLLGKVLFGNRWVGLVAAWILAVSLWPVAQSRWIIPAAIVPAITALFILALVWAAKTRSGSALLLAAAAGVVGIATYQSLRGYIALLMLAAAIAWWGRYRAIPARSIAMAGLIFAAVALPTILFILRDEAGGSRFRQVSVFAEDSFYLPEGETVDARFLIGQYLDYFSPQFLLREGGEYYPWVLPRNVGALPLAVVLLAIVGVVLLVRRAVRARDDWERGVAIFLLLALLFYPISGALSLPGPTAVRVIHGLPIIALIAAFGGVESFTLARRRLGRQRGSPGQIAVTLAAAAVIIVFAYQVVDQTRTYFANYADETAADFHYGIEGAVDYALANEDLYDEIWIFHVNEPYIYVLFHGGMDPAAAREEMTIVRDAPNFNWVTELGKFRSAPRIWYDPPDDLPVAQMPTLYQTFNPDGTVAYEVRGGPVPGRGNVMVIYRPEWF